MNELRMYVEHLFEGKVLTSDAIELKEEIYGNLVARYEDYRAQGMSADDALAKTMASITSIDDVIEDGASSNGDSNSASDASEVDAGAPHVEHGDDDAAGVGEAQTTRMPRVPGAPEPPKETAGNASSATAQSSTRVSKSTAKKPLVIVGIVAAVLVVLLVVVGFAFGVPGLHDARLADATKEVITETDEVQDGSATTNGGVASNADNTSQNGANGNRYQDGMDAEDALEYQMTGELAQEIEACGAEQLRAYADADNVTFAQLVKNLPLGAYVSGAGNAASGGSYSITYSDVHDAYDGDMVDRALVYNAVALMALYPDVDTINMSLHEQDDHEHDVDVYSFQRRRLENGLSNISGNAITKIDGTLIATDSAWDEACTYILTEHFCDNQLDVAEVN